jgi:hypothetical protein
MMCGVQYNGTEQLTAFSGRKILNGGLLLSVPPFTDANCHFISNKSNGYIKHYRELRGMRQGRKGIFR